MSNQAKFESEAMSLLRHLKSEKEAIQLRHTSELEEIDREIDAVSITLRLLREVPESKDQIEEIKPSVIPNDLFGKSTREACIEIAKKNNGIVYVSEAKKALIAARILKDSKNTWAIVYTTLHRSKEFEKTGIAGGFRLLTYPTKEAAQASFLK
ncbi:MAG: hypothetical protein ABSC77_02125 [Terracidiphilus sp.]